MRLLVEPASGHEELVARWIALRRFALASALLLGGAAAIFGLWSLRTGVSAPAADPSQEIVYRRDVVRDLAEAERASGGGDGVEPLASGREGHRDRGADPPRR